MQEELLLITTVIAYQGKLATRNIWAFIRQNKLSPKLKEHAGKTIKQIRREELLAFLEFLSQEKD